MGFFWVLFDFNSNLVQGATSVSGPAGFSISDWEFEVHHGLKFT